MYTLPLAEHFTHTTPLHQTTLFPYATSHLRPSLTQANLSFRFPVGSSTRSHGVQSSGGAGPFSKKRALPFFLALELLTQQKGIAALAPRDLPVRKVRKGSLVGCSVTLRRRSLVSCLTRLTLSLPRREKLTPSVTYPSLINTSTKGSIYESPLVSSHNPLPTSWRLLSFAQRRRLAYQRELQGRFPAARRLRLLPPTRSSAATLRSSSNTNKVPTPFQPRVRGARLSANPGVIDTRNDGLLFSFGELLLLHPFERGLGLHPDIHQLFLRIRLSSPTLEEAYLLFRTAHLPVL